MSPPSQRVPSRGISAVPAGAPAWITDELMEDTRKTWQPYYAELLTDTDLLEILLDVGRLFDALEVSDE